jgi:hypothetical protein
MGLVKANMSFYHDKVGSRAAYEVFEVKNEETCAQLEQVGYVSKVSSEEAQMHQKMLQQQQEVGKRNALTNEAVSLANHVHNLEANKHSENVMQFRQQGKQQQNQNDQGTFNAEEPQTAHNNHAAAKAKKADR